VNDRPNYITPAGLATLRARYAELQSVERPKIVETVSWAAGNGDRSENGDYIYGVYAKLTESLAGFQSG
jgi:transcription elongation factor GreB